MHGSRRYHTPCRASGIVFGREHFQLLLRPQPGLPRRRLLHVHVHDFLHAGPIVESASPSLARQSHMRNLQKTINPYSQKLPPICRSHTPQQIKQQEKLRFAGRREKNEATASSSFSCCKARSPIGAWVCALSSVGCGMLA